MLLCYRVVNQGCRSVNSPYSDTLRWFYCSQNQSPCLSHSYRGRTFCDPTNLSDMASQSCRDTHYLFSTFYLQIEGTRCRSNINPQNTQININRENCTFSRSNGRSSCWDSHRCNHERRSASWCTLTRVHTGLRSIHQCSWCHSNL